MRYRYIAFIVIIFCLTACKNKSGESKIMSEQRTGRMLEGVLDRTIFVKEHKPVLYSKEELVNDNWIKGSSDNISGINITYDDISGNFLITGLDTPPIDAQINIPDRNYRTRITLSSTYKDIKLKVNEDIVIITKESTTFEFDTEEVGNIKFELPEAVRNSYKNTSIVITNVEYINKELYSVPDEFKNIDVENINKEQQIDIGSFSYFNALKLNGDTDTVIRGTEDVLLPKIKPNTKQGYLIFHVIGEDDTKVSFTINYRSKYKRKYKGWFTVSQSEKLITLKVEDVESVTLNTLESSNLVIIGDIHELENLESLNLNEPQVYTKADSLNEYKLPENFQLDLTSREYELEKYKDAPNTAYLKYKPNIEITKDWYHYQDYINKEINISTLTSYKIDLREGRVGSVRFILKVNKDCSLKFRSGDKEETVLYWYPLKKDELTKIEFNVLYMPSMYISAYTELGDTTEDRVQVNIIDFEISKSVFNIDDIIYIPVANNISEFRYQPYNIISERCQYRDNSKPELDKIEVNDIIYDRGLIYYLSNDNYEDLLTPTIEINNSGKIYDVIKFTVQCRNDKSYLIIFGDDANQLISYIEVEQQPKTYSLSFAGNTKISLYTYAGENIELNSKLDNIVLTDIELGTTTYKLNSELLTKNLIME